MGSKKLLLIGASIVLLLVFTIALLLPRSTTPTQKPKAITMQIESSPVIPTITLVDENQPIPTGPHFQEEIASAWGAVDFSENDLQGLHAKKDILTDGESRYAFDSDSPDRPDMIIAKDDIIIFTRQILLDTKTDNYIAANGKPEYTLRETGFYGPDSVTYVYPTRGTAFTVNTKANDVLEQFIFKPTSIEEFNRKYKQYLL